MLDRPNEDQLVQPTKHFRSPALEGAIGQRWVNLLMAVQVQWHEHEAQRGRVSGPCLCNPCRVYRSDWWD